MGSEKDRQAEEARARYKASLKKRFPSIGTVHSVHQGLNREQRRMLKYTRAGRKLFSAIPNTQKPAFM